MSITTTNTTTTTTVANTTTNTATTTTTTTTTAATRTTTTIVSIFVHYVNLRIMQIIANNKEIKIQRKNIVLLDEEDFLSLVLTLLKYSSFMCFVL
ncbi:unnamed protein product [Schistosoma bovis]|nr:unnamed protein product [Schistosoma bovis]